MSSSRVYILDPENRGSEPFVGTADEVMAQAKRRSANRKRTLAPLTVRANPGERAREYVGSVREMERGESQPDVWSTPGWLGGVSVVTWDDGRTTGRVTHRSHSAAWDAEVTKVAERFPSSYNIERQLFHPREKDLRRKTKAERLRIFRADLNRRNKAPEQLQQANIERDEKANRRVIELYEALRRQGVEAGHVLEETQMTRFIWDNMQVKEPIEYEAQFRALVGKRNSDGWHNLGFPTLLQETPDGRFVEVTKPREEWGAWGEAMVEAGFRGKSKGGPEFIPKATKLDLEDFKKKRRAIKKKRTRASMGRTRRGTL